MFFAPRSEALAAVGRDDLGGIVVLEADAVGGEGGTRGRAIGADTLMIELAIWSKGAAPARPGGCRRQGVFFGRPVGHHAAEAVARRLLDLAPGIDPERHVKLGPGLAIQNRSSARPARATSSPGRSAALLRSLWPSG